MVSDTNEGLATRVTIPKIKPLFVHSYTKENNNQLFNVSGFDSVEFSYPDHSVLKSLSFQADPGEILGFLGVNGAGKTTTFKLATGLLRPSSGEIRTASVDPAAGKEWCPKVGVMLSGGGLYPRLTVRRNIAFFAELHGSKPDLSQHLEQHGLAAYADKPAAQLSQGYRRRLALARATVHQPQLLLLDEPADALDPGATEELHDFLRSFRDGGGGVVLSSHRLEEVERLCDRIVLLDKGEIVSQGTPKELSGAGGLRTRILEMQGRGS